MNESQRAMVAAKLADIKVGDNQNVGSENLPTKTSQTQASELLNVSERSIRTAKKLELNATPELTEKVEQVK